jgi:hypothetical protein
LSRSNKLASRTFWLIVRHEAGRMEVLTTGLPSGEEALPVFSFEDEARMFLGLGAFDGDWRVRETGAGELISILYCLCTSVDRVVLDPLSGPYAVLNDLVSMGREAFVEFAGEEGCGAPSAPIASTNRAGQRPPDRPGAKNGRARRSSQCVPDGRPADATAQTATLERR